MAATPSPSLDDLLAQDAQLAPKVAQAQAQETAAATPVADQSKQTVQFGVSKQGDIFSYDPALVRFQTAGLLMFSLVVAGLAFYLLLKNHPADQILRALLIPVIIGTAAFLVIGGYSSDQITPVIGLLGTIAGYVLGSARNAPLVPPDTQSQTGKAPLGS